MQLYKKYISLSLLMPVIVVTLTLTGIIWLSQSLRFVDLIVNKGLDVATFLYLSLLLVPSLLIIILPVALFTSTIFVYNKLTAESELLVFKSAGISRIGLSIPALLVASCITLVIQAISLYALPKSYKEFKEMQDFIRNNYASVLLQEGVFSTPVDRLTVYIESRDAEGILHGILVHDARNPERPSTMMAQAGSLLQTPAGPRFQLINGNRQEVNKKNGNLSLLYFDSYPLDLSIYGGVGTKRVRVAEERYISELLNPEETDEKIRNTMIIEGHHRIIWPFLAITLTLVALAALCSGQLNRRGQWKRILSATLLTITIIAIDLGLKNIATKNPVFVFLLYANAILPAIFCLYILVTSKNINGIDSYKITKYFNSFMPTKRALGGL